MDAIGKLQELAPRSSARLWAFFAVEAALGFMCGALSLRGNTAGELVGVLFIVVGAAFPTCYWLWLANTRLLIGSGLVGYQNLLGSRRTWPTSEIARAVEITILYRGRYGTRPKQALLLVDTDGRCLQKIRIEQWPPDAISAFEAATGRSPEYAGQYPTGLAAQQFPGSVGFMYAHVWWTGLIAVGIVVVLAVLFEVFLVLPSH